MNSPADEGRALFPSCSASDPSRWQSVANGGFQAVCPLDEIYDGPMALPPVEVLANEFTG
jgi:hypothetical protein